MNRRYYLITAEQYSNVADDLEYSPAWNLANTQCIIEVSMGYEVPGYLMKFGSPEECNSWRFHPDRINEWQDDSDID
jgi:hypothetical protein